MSNETERKINYLLPDPQGSAQTQMIGIVFKVINDILHIEAEVGDRSTNTSKIYTFKLDADPNDIVTSKWD